MKIKIHKYDFLVIGAGLIGALAGLELFKKKFKVLVVEKNNQSLLDQRTLAVNANSRDFLNSLGLWRKLVNEPIKNIIVKDEMNASPLIFENIHESMGSVIYNKDLLLKTRDQLKLNNILIENIELDINNINFTQPLKLKNKYYIFNKIILSVGKNIVSNTQFKKSIFNSHHQSYVGFFNHNLNHKNKAYEIFTKKGPLAVLPAPSSKKYLSTFIYSSKIPIQINELKKLIKKYFHKTHGQLFFKKDFKSFKISPHMTRSDDKNIILLGDSLRSIHPVAGQGWNLGIKDIQTLSELLDQYNIEDHNFTEIYFSRRKIENCTYLAFTNFINSLYENDSKINQSIINFGFQSLLRFAPIRKTFINQAMGRFSLV